MPTNYYKIRLLEATSIIVYSIPRHVILCTPTCYWSSHHRGQSLHPKVELYGNNQRLFMVHFQPLSIYPLQSQTLPYKAMVMSTTPTPSKCFQMDFNRSHNEQINFPTKSLIITTFFQNNSYKLLPSKSHFCFNLSPCSNSILNNFLPVRSTCFPI